MEKSEKEFLQSEAGRKWFISKSLEAIPENIKWHSIKTPYDFCEKMISKTTVEGKNILVLFNVEFLEILIYTLNVSFRNITFISDCNVESEISKKIYKVDSVLLPDKKIESINEVLKPMKKFDLCFSNPPYGQRQDVTHLKILKTIIPICNEVIFVHPANWLLTIKPNQLKIFNDIKTQINTIVNSIEIFNGNPIFDIDIMGPCCITHINHSHKGSIDVNYFNQKYYTVDDIHDITIFCEEWVTIVKSFQEKIKSYIDRYGSIANCKNRMIDIIKDKTRHFCQFTAMQPGTGDKTGVYMHGEDLYKIINPDQNYILSYDELKDSQIKYFFDTKIELDNFLNYLKTDFARFCLSIYKTTQHLENGEIALIPNMDFREAWVDEKLYKFFKIDQTTIKYITNFFPDDLYNLRK